MALKNEMLELFEQNRGTAFSGTALAERFGVSRNAVWKAVNALKADGHEIISDGRRGYLLSDKSDRLSVEGITAYLPNALSDIELFVYDEISSTNDAARRYLLEGGKSNAVFISEKQTAGRTRGGGSFYSPYGTGLYITVLVRKDIELKHIDKIANDIPNAVKRAVQLSTGVKTEIKLPGDLYIGEHKVCGILASAEIDLYSKAVTNIIVGIGINITTEHFPEELRGKVASLGTATIRCRLAAEIIRQIYSIN